MTLDARLLGILACPADKGPLLYFRDEGSLYNPRLRLLYRIDDGIPVMLTDEAQRLGDPEHQRLLEKAQADGVAPTFEPGAETSGSATGRDAAAGGVVPAVESEAGGTGTGETP